MGIFPSRKFRPSSYQYTIGASYRSALSRHPFLLFGLPFIVTMVAGSFVLTPATALRYERHDLKVSQLSKEDELGLGKDRRKVDMNEEYYRLAAKVGFCNWFMNGRERMGW
jgi:cytochrome c oxidase assembly protein subunit 16